MTLLALEGRGLFDIASLATAAPLLTLASQGTRHAVIVLPGLGADDRSTVAIRSFLSSFAMKSTAGAWDATFGHPMLICQRSSRRSRAFAPQQIFPSASSAGAGVASARQLPATVRMVITLGSPFAAPRASNVASIWRLLTGGNDTAPSPEGIKLLARPIPVPATSIYTRSDGVVAWQACLEEAGPRRENIEVRTTHIGRGFIHPLSGPLPTGPAVW